MIRLDWTEKYVYSVTCLESISQHYPIERGPRVLVEGTEMNIN